MYIIAWLAIFKRLPRAPFHAQEFIWNWRLNWKKKKKGLFLHEFGLGFWWRAVFFLIFYYLMLSVFAAAAVLQAALFYKHSSYHWTPLVEKPAKDPVLCSPGIYMYLKWMGYFDGRVFVVLISDIVYVLSFDRVVKREEWLSNSLKCVHDQSFEMIIRDRTMVGAGMYRLRGYTATLRSRSFDTIRYDATRLVPTTQPRAHSTISRERTKKRLQICCLNHFQLF